MTFTPETTREEVAALFDSLSPDSQIKLYDWNYEAPDLDPGAHIIIRKVTEGFQWQRFNTGWYADWGFRDRDDLIDIVHNNRDNPDVDLKVVEKEG